MMAMEKGTGELSPQELVRLAEIYVKPVSDLLRRTPPPRAIGTRFRAALASAPDADELAGAVSQLEEQADNYLDLLRRADTEAPGRYQPARNVSHLDPWQAGEDLATEERNRLGIGDGPVLPLREALQIEAGLPGFLRSLPPHVAGRFIIVDC